MYLDFQALTDRLERAHSKRLALRPVSLADAWPLYQATRNPLFNKHLAWEQPEDEHPVLTRIGAIADASRSGRMTALSCVVKTTGEWVALFRFQPYGGDARAMEMGVWIHDRFWHGRYSLELGRLCVDAAFDSCEVARLMAASTMDNRGSYHLMKSVGMSETQVVLRHSETGRPLVLQEFELSRGGWAARKGKHAAVPNYSSIPEIENVVTAQPPVAQRLHHPASPAEAFTLADVR